MSLFKPVAIEQAAAKVGIFGRQGAGKTTTAMLLAIGLAKTYHNGAPIFMLDTENGSDYLKPIADAEGVQLFVGKSRAFVDLRSGLKEAEKAGACAYLVDSYTHTWNELVESLKKKKSVRKLEFHHQDELKGNWRQWTDQMLASNLHVLLCGRLGNEWGQQEDEETGKQELIKLGTKMKGEGEAGYEPSLLIEMEGVQSADKRLKSTRAKKGSIVHHAYVLKDRWRALNGRTLAFKDINNYAKGDYQRIFDAFRPHFDNLAIGGQQRAIDSARSSEDLFNRGGESDYARRSAAVAIALEEIKENVSAVWGGMDAKSKQIRQVVMEQLFSTLSWTAVERMSLEKLEVGAAVCKSMRELARDGAAAVDDPEKVPAFVQQARDFVEFSKSEAVRANDAANDEMPVI